MSEQAPREIDREQFCFFPFMQLLLQPTGDVSPCCWNQRVVVGRMPEQSLSEIWNGEPMRALRREFLDGTPKTCETQMRHVGCHRFTRRHPDQLSQLKFTEVQAAGPTRLDLRLNGRCNLQCVMCDVWEQPNGLYDESDFWKSGPKDIFPFLREVDMLGGEPFVQADTYRLIDEVYALNPSCSWAFVTNGQYKLNQAIRGRLDKIPLRWMQLSLDSLDPGAYARIRVKGILQRSLDTLEILCQMQAERLAEGRPFRLHASMCVQKENWGEVGAFLDLTWRKSLVADLQFAYGPTDVSLLSLDEEERRRIAQYFLEVAVRHDIDVIRPVLLPLQESLSP